MNVCACGAPADAPHAPRCPYPLYDGTPMDYERWKLARLKALPAQPGSRAAQDATTKRKPAPVAW